MEWRAFFTGPIGVLAGVGWVRAFTAVAVPCRMGTPAVAAH